LLEKGADVNSKNFKGIYALFWLLTAARSDLCTISSAGESPLHLAVTSDEAKMAMLLLEKGASVGSRDSEGLTPLHRAAQSSDDKGCISMLIKAGAGTL
jgi:ankyrin repeat protein